MKNLFYKLIIGGFSIVPILGYSQNNDFVNLQGKQFKLNNLNFYPVTVNYRVDIVRNDYGLEFIAPLHSYDLTNDYEITDGSGVLNESDSFNQILNDFQTIKDMARLV